MQSVTAFNSVKRFPTVDEIKEGEVAHKELVRKTSERGFGRVYGGLGRQPSGRIRTEPTAVFTTAPRFGERPSTAGRQGSAHGRPNSAPAGKRMSSTAPGAISVDATPLPSSMGKQVIAGKPSERRVLFSRTARFPGDPPLSGTRPGTADPTMRRRKKGRAGAGAGAPPLSPVFSSFGKQSTAGLRSSSSAVFPTTTRRVSHRTPAPADVNPTRQDLSRAPAYLIGTQRRFEPTYVLGVNTRASPGPAAYETAAAKDRVTPAPVRVPGWSQPKSKPRRWGNGKPRDMNIYRF